MTCVCGHTQPEHDTKGCHQHAHCGCPHYEPDTGEWDNHSIPDYSNRFRWTPGECQPFEAAR